MRLGRLQYNVVADWLRVPETLETAKRNGENREELAARFNLENQDHPLFASVTVTKNHLHKIFKEDPDLPDYPRGRHSRGDDATIIVALRARIADLEALAKGTLEVQKFLFGRHLSQYPGLDVLFEKQQSLLNRPRLEGS